MLPDQESSIRPAARLAGGLYLSLIPLGIFSFAYVPSILVVRGDAAATSRNIMESELLFRLGIGSHLLSQVVVVFLLLALFRTLRVVNRDRALAMLVLGLLCVPISFVAELQALGALDALRGMPDGPFSAAQTHAHAIHFLDMHRSGVLLAQVFWALWMLPLAALVWRSGLVPRVLAIPVLIAAAGYLLDSGTHLLTSDGTAISMWTALGELPLPLWLLTKGVSHRLMPTERTSHESLHRP